MVVIRRRVPEIYYYENVIVCNKMTECAEYISLHLNTTLPTQICLKIRISNHSLRKCGAINLLVYFMNLKTAQIIWTIYIQGIHFAVKTLNTTGRIPIIYTDCNYCSVTMLKTVVRRLKVSHNRPR